MKTLRWDERSKSEGGIWWFYDKTHFCHAYSPLLCICIPPHQGFKKNNEDTTAARWIMNHWELQRSWSTHGCWIHLGMCEKREPIHSAVDVPACTAHVSAAPQAFLHWLQVSESLPSSIEGTLGSNSAQTCSAKNCWQDSGRFWLYLTVTERTLLWVSFLKPSGCRVLKQSRWRKSIYSPDRVLI